jgi:hypothetical protein
VCKAGTLPLEPYPQPFALAIFCAGRVGSSGRELALKA